MCGALRPFAGYGKAFAASAAESGSWLTRERRSIWRVGPESTWTTVLPVAFIIISLLSLVILPVLVSRHTETMRLEIARVAEPARREANQIQIDLSNEVDKIIAWQVTGQEHYRAEYFVLVQQEEANRRLLMQR